MQHPDLLLQHPYENTCNIPLKHLKHLKCTLETFIVSRCGLLRCLHQGAALYQEARLEGSRARARCFSLRWRRSKSIRTGAQSRRQGQLGERRSRSSEAGARSNGRDGRKRSVGLVRMPKKRSPDGTDAMNKAFRIKKTRHTVLRCMLLCQVGFSRD
jgi:hypothetical protein